MSYKVDSSRVGHAHDGRVRISDDDKTQVIKLKVCPYVKLHEEFIFLGVLYSLFYSLNALKKAN